MYEDKFIKIACQVSLYFLKTIHRNVIKKSSIYNLILPTFCLVKIHKIYVPEKTVLIYIV